MPFAQAESLLVAQDKRTLDYEARLIRAPFGSNWVMTHATDPDGRYIEVTGVEFIVTSGLHRICGRINGQIRVGGRYLIHFSGAGGARLTAGLQVWAGMLRGNYVAAHGELWGRTCTPKAIG